MVFEISKIWVFMMSESVSGCAMQNSKLFSCYEKSLEIHDIDFIWSWLLANVFVQKCCTQLHNIHWWQQGRNCQTCCRERFELEFSTTEKRHVEQWILLHTWLQRLQDLRTQPLSVRTIYCAALRSMIAIEPYGLGSGKQWFGDLTAAVKITGPMNGILLQQIVQSIVIPIANHLSLVQYDNATSNCSVRQLLQDAEGITLP